MNGIGGSSLGSSPQTEHAKGSEEIIGDEAPIPAVALLISLVIDTGHASGTDRAKRPWCCPKLVDVQAREQKRQEQPARYGLLTLAKILTPALEVGFRTSACAFRYLRFDGRTMADDTHVLQISRLSLQYCCLSSQPFQHQRCALISLRLFIFTFGWGTSVR